MKIDVKGPIVNDDDKWIYDWFGIKATSPQDVHKAILNNPENENLEVVINSGGGSVFAGSEIYTSLKDYKGKVIVKIVGLAASAASVIAMAGDEVQMSPTGQLMIHNSAVTSSGDHREMNHTSEILKSIDASIANAYELKTGLQHDELLKLMGNETWLGATKAKELKFIDKIMFQDEISYSNSISLDKHGLLPAEVVEKMRNELSEKKIKNKDDFESIEMENELLRAKAKLKLKLKLI